MKCLKIVKNVHHNFPEPKVGLGLRLVYNTPIHFKTKAVNRVF